ncbi:MAG: YbgC/FadM family acyl-CoA thioesterase [Chloroflexota bacterium]
MSAVFTRRFRVRHYECDAYGHLNNVNYVRYMQETALDASQAVGWDTDRYHNIGHQWLIRETDIEYLRPLRWNDEVEVTSYVLDFRRIQSRRRYEFRNVADNALVAQATTNWAYLNTQTQQTARIPHEMIKDFAPNGLPDVSPMERFPKPPPQPKGVFHHQRRAEWRDIDTVGHLNNAAYMAYCEDASTQVGRDLGWSMQRMLDEGFALVLRRFRIQYLQAAFLDDDLRISTWVSDVKRATALRHYDVRRASDNTLLARAYGMIVCFDLDKQRPMRVPQTLLDDFADNIVS